jgi:hypothetical protein
MKAEIEKREKIIDENIKEKDFFINTIKTLEKDNHDIRENFNMLQYNYNELFEKYKRLEGQNKTTGRKSISSASGVMLDYLVTEEAENEEININQETLVPESNTIDMKIKLKNIKLPFSKYMPMPSKEILKKKNSEQVEIHSQVYGNATKQQVGETGDQMGTLKSVASNYSYGSLPDDPNESIYNKHEAGTNEDQIHEKYSEDGSYSSNNDIKKEFASETSHYDSKLNDYVDPGKKEYSREEYSFNSGEQGNYISFPSKSGDYSSDYNSSVKLSNKNLIELKIDYNSANES